MKSSITLLIVFVSILHSALCYTHTNVQSRNRIFNLKEKFFSARDTEESVRQTDGTEKTFQQPPVTIIEVQREVLDNKLKFTVKYESTVTSLIVNWYYVLEDPGTTTTERYNGVYETSAWGSLPEISSDSDDSKTPGVVLILSTSDKRESMQIALLNLEEDVVVTDIPAVPRLDVEPVGDFVYEEGEDFTFKVRVPKKMHHGDISYDFDILHVFLDLETGDVDLYDTEKHMDLLDNHEYQDFQEFTTKIKTSENRISGAFTMKSIIGTWNTDSGVIESVVRTKNVILRPATQAGPFPDGFLALVETHDQLVEGTFFCGVGEGCMYRSVAVGPDITELKCERIRSDGTVELLENSSHRSTHPWYFHGPYVQKEMSYLQVDSIPEDPEMILCTAKNAQGKVVTQEIPLVVFVPASFIEEDSGIELVNDQDDAAVKKFIITCTVQGEPQPNVTFNVGTLYRHDPPVPPDEIVATGDMTYKMILHKSFDADELSSGTSSGILQVDCQAEQESLQYSFYDMSYPSYDIDNN